MKKYRAVFFDLDGTLIHMPQDLFEKECLKSEAEVLAKRFGMEEKAFLDLINLGVYRMIKNDGTRRNIDVFCDCVSPEMGSAERINRLFDSYYKNEFASLISVTTPNPLAAELVKEARRLSDFVVLSTLPVFPPSAQRTRLSFIGLTPEDFDLVTDSFNSSFCKPDPAYFQDLLRRFGCEACDCLVVGNDPRDDISAANAAGIPAVLLTDFEVVRPEWAHVVCERYTCKEFLEILRKTI